MNTETLIKLVADLRSDMADLKKEVATLKAENTALRAENKQLKAKNELLRQENVSLKLKVSKLEVRLSKNSNNSSKPPSSDGLRKKPNPRSLREKSGRSSGGQKGHEGKTLRQADSPDEVHIHELRDCSNCHNDLSDLVPLAFEKRQVFDIPEPKIEIIEHLAEKKICPACGKNNVASFPGGVEAPVQYGPRLKGLVVYAQNYQMVPAERLTEFLFDVYGISLSQGTVFNIAQRAHDELEPFEQRLKELLMDADILHVDETGARVNKKLYWIHSASTETFTHYGASKKRGQEATDAIGILPNFNGTLVHDCWAPYFNLDVRHALCNAHLLRELNGVIESTKQVWAVEMRELLRKANKDVKQTEEGCLSEPELKKLSTEYRKIIERGYIETGGAGPVDRTDSRCLWERFILHDKRILLFAEAPEVPFDNNQAERDIRMVKVKQKISGCFRSEQGAEQFARIRSYISTAKKQGRNILEVLQGIFMGSPFCPAY